MLSKCLVLWIWESIIGVVSSKLGFGRWIGFQQNSRQREQGEKRHGGANKQGDSSGTLGMNAVENVLPEGLRLSQVSLLCDRLRLSYAVMTGIPNILLAYQNSGLLLPHVTCPWSLHSTPGLRTQPLSGILSGSRQREKRDMANHRLTWKWHKTLMPTFHWPKQVHAKASWQWGRKV